MSTFPDIWDEPSLTGVSGPKALLSDEPIQTIASPKTMDFQTVNANLDKANLTPAEQYSMGWGKDAVPEQWVKQKAQEITNQINGSKSIDVLKNSSSTVKPAVQTQAEKDAAAVKDAAANPSSNPSSNPSGELPGSGNGGKGIGSTGTSSTSSDGHEASSGWGLNAMGVDSAGLSASGALKGLAVAGPVGAVVGAVAPGISADPLGKFAYNALVSQENRDIAAHENGATDGSNNNTGSTQAGVNGPAPGAQTSRNMPGASGEGDSDNGGGGGFSGGKTGGTGEGANGNAGNGRD